MANSVGEVRALSSLTAANAGCLAECTTTLDLTLDFQNSSSATQFALGLLGSEILAQGSDTFRLTIEDALSSRQFAFSDAAAAAEFFADHIVFVYFMPGQVGHLEVSLALTSSTPGDVFAASFVFAQVPEPEAAWLFATLALLLPGWRNWQTRRP